MLQLCGGELTLKLENTDSFLGFSITLLIKLSLPEDGSVEAASYCGRLGVLGLQPGDGSNLARSFVACSL